MAGDATRSGSGWGARRRRPVAPATLLLLSIALGVVGAVGLVLAGAVYEGGGLLLVAVALALVLRDERGR